MIQSHRMKTAAVISPVNMKARQALELHAGDTVRVWQKIEELKLSKGKNKKEVATKNIRRQAFDGLVLAVKHGNESGATFTVRKVSLGVGVERIFPLYSTMIDEIEVLRRARTRRAKLYFIRRKAAKEAKRAMRKQSQVNLTSAVAEEAPVEVTPQNEEATVE